MLTCRLCFNNINDLKHLEQADEACIQSVCCRVHCVTSTGFQLPPCADGHGRSKSASWQSPEGQGLGFGTSMREF